MTVATMPALRRQRAARVPAPVRRTQILDAAIELFARTGFHDGSTAALAARLGVSEPTLYRHFPSKRALYVATLDHSAELLLGHWRTLAAAASTPLDAPLFVRAVAQRTRDGRGTAWDSTAGLDDDWRP